MGMPFAESEDVHGWLAALVEHLKEASELGDVALEHMNAGDTQTAVDYAKRMRLPVTQCSHALLGFLAEMHDQGIDPQ
jgi:hypothetical protein